MDTWEMHAHRHDDGRFHTVGPLPYVRNHMFREPIYKVLVEEVPDDDETGTHWGWMRFAYMHYSADTEPGMIWGHRGQFEMCFPYGSKPEQDRVSTLGLGPSVWANLTLFSKPAHGDACRRYRLRFRFSRGSSRVCGSRRVCRGRWRSRPGPL